VAEDQARLEAVRGAIGADGLVRIDANGAWSVDEAIAWIPLLDKAAGGLEYVEQPVIDVEDLAVVRRRVDVPIAADESIRRAEDPYRVRDLEAADVAVLKVQPLGGVRACLRIAEDIGMPVVVSSALESSLGLAAGVALAAVRRRVDVPIAADESIRRAEDPYRVRDLEAADIAVLKVQPLGGVRACLRIAHDIGMPVVVSSALETSLGLAAGVALAAALPDLDHACGLATRSLLTADVASPELVPVNGELSVGVPTMVPALLAGVAASPDRTAWWAERLAAVRVLREAGRS
jgi:L-alanine-DL-glutamate epimerase-like enolase superfamily enzyme